MKEEKDILEYDDSLAIEFITNRLPQDMKSLVDEDKILYVLDVICEYYEDNNLFEEDDIVSEAEISQDDMFNYIYAAIKRDKEVSITEEQLHTILELEYEYGCSIGIYV